MFFVEKENFNNCLLIFDFLVFMYKDDVEGCGFEFTIIGDSYIVFFIDIVDVDGDVGIGFDVVFFY